MKSNPRVLLLFAAALVATAAHAQYGSTPIKHVIVIFQENRTPDNLFQGLCTANGGVPGCSATGAEGTYDIASTYVNSDGQTVPLTPVGLATNFDLDHSHGGPKLNGTISGFNFEFKNQGISGKPAANVPEVCGANIFGCVVPADNYSQFMYVYNTPVTNSNGSRGGLLDPYITLATTYGWAQPYVPDQSRPELSGASIYFWRHFSAYCGRRRARCLCGGECSEYQLWLRLGRFGTTDQAERKRGATFWHGNPGR